jgi:4-diphosphocytidyl-2-C-methyl-D-erythritol kinase
VAAVAPALTWWPAPAKLNLFLHVVGRYADGYHELQTLFQLIDLCDRIGLAVRDDGRIERVTGMPEIASEHDLAVRAAQALQRHTGVQFGADLHVIKHIPAGGGLGGGSSDAATVLLGLNELWGTGLALEELSQLGLTLGADVPVFIHGSSAWGEGRGERLQAVTLPKRWFLVIHPGVAVSTAQIFQAPELTRNSSLITIRAFAAGQGGNVCEPVVRTRYPAVAAALDWLDAQLAMRDGSGRARLTGTGACLFAAFEYERDARQIAQRVPEGWISFVARGLDRSPLHVMLGMTG